jgi:prepilin peptidase CpaA
MSTFTFLGLEPGQVVALGLGALACWFDIRTRRIPNLLTFGGAAVALGYSLVTAGPNGLATSALGWLAGAALFLPFFVLGGMGAGDVKLVACLGAWLGPLTAVYVDLYAAVAGGVMALALALATGYLGQALTNVWLLLAHWRVVGIRPLPELTLEGARGPRLPYAVPIAAGAVAAIWFK